MCVCGKPNLASLGCCPTTTPCFPLRQSKEETSLVLISLDLTKSQVVYYSPIVLSDVIESNAFQVSVSSYYTKTLLLTEEGTRHSHTCKAYFVLLPVRLYRWCFLHLNHESLHVFKTRIRGDKTLEWCLIL